MLNAAQQNYLDFSALNHLKHRSKTDAKSTLKEVASEFETIFVKMVMKSMRSASFGDELFDSESAKFYRDMYDDQLSLELAKDGGIGLADILVKQLERYIPQDNISSFNKKPIEKSDPVFIQDNVAEPRFTSTKDFVHQLWPHAVNAAKELGTSPKVIIAQAALETGWGKYIIRKADGSSSNNLFNIKADKRWQGETSRIETLEYIGNIPRKESAQFRAYATLEESIQDYVNFLKNNSRYKAALQTDTNESQFIEKIHAAGYATDPNYNEKVKRILSDKPLNDALLSLPSYANG